MTTGGVELGAKLEGTTNVEVCGWIDHSELLQSIDLMFGHGVHSSTMKAIAHGVPLLVLPVNPIADQRLIGRVIHAEGLGRFLSKTAAIPKIRDVVRGIHRR